MSNVSEHCSPYLTISDLISSIFKDFQIYFNIFQLPRTLKARGVACHSLAGAVFDTKSDPKVPPKMTPEVIPKVIPKVIQK